MIYTKTIKIDKDTVDEMNKIINRPHGITDTKRDTVISKWSVKFENDMEVDLKVVNGDERSGGYCEVVLFNANGYELDCTFPLDELTGEFHLSPSLVDNDDIYTLKVEVE